MLKKRSKAPAVQQEDGGVQQEDGGELTQFVEPTTITKPGGVGEYFLTKKALCEKVGLTFPFIWQMIRKGKFPEGRAVGSRTLWISSEIDAWILARVPQVSGGRVTWHNVKARPIALASVQFLTARQKPSLTCRCARIPKVFRYSPT